MHVVLLLCFLFSCLVSGRTPIERMTRSAGKVTFDCVRTRRAPPMPGSNPATASPR